MNKIVQECPNCQGTGLYRGFAEATGEAVVCLGCDGQGWTTHSYRPFTGRKQRSGVKTVRQSRGSFIATGVGGAGDAMTYSEFERKYAAKEPRC